MRPNLFKLTLSSALIYAMSIMGSANSAEINVPGFTGTANHTVTSGLSMRIADYNCSLYTGYSYTETGISAGLNTASRGNGKGVFTMHASVDRCIRQHCFSVQQLHGNTAQR